MSKSDTTGPTQPWGAMKDVMAAQQPIEAPHWTVHYREWVAEHPDISKLGLIEQMEAYLKAFPESGK